jgi:6-pyruvoyl-tetrahydropterin synthase
MVLDFNDFKPFKKYIDDTFDHSVMCTIENYSDYSNCERICVIPNSTTSEDIAEFLCNKFFELILQNQYLHIEKIEVLVSETENNKASFSRILT